MTNRALTTGVLPPRRGMLLFFPALAVFFCSHTLLPLGQQLLIHGNLLRSQDRFHPADLLLLDLEHRGTVGVSNRLELSLRLIQNCFKLGDLGWRQAEL